jgi:hypothetical protein
MLETKLERSTQMNNYLWKVYMVRADHPDPNYREAEIRETATGRIINSGGIRWKEAAQDIVNAHNRAVKQLSEKGTVD